MSLSVLQIAQVPKARVASTCPSNVILILFEYFGYSFVNFENILKRVKRYTFWAAPPFPPTPLCFHVRV